MLTTNLFNSKDWLNVVFQHFKSSVLAHLKVKLDHSSCQSILIIGALLLYREVLVVRVAFVDKSLEIPDLDGCSVVV
jgi:hypothetical protein